MVYQLLHLIGDFIPFLVFNYLQPLVIAVAFLWSKRVGLLYVGLFKKASSCHFHVDVSKLESNVTQTLTVGLFDKSGALYFSVWIFSPKRHV